MAIYQMDTKNASQDSTEHASCFEDHVVICHGVETVNIRRCKHAHHFVTLGDF